MAKKKKKDEILDTSAPPIDLDVTVKDEDVDENGLVDLNIQKHRSPDTVVFSMRMLPEELEHFKQLARKQSVRTKKDVPYQRFITEAALKQYPMGE
ncbi:MAG: hypothetical protein ACTSSP_10030 [Candidatus Asgardarchaeia archaeon]